MTTYLCTCAQHNGVSKKNHEQVRKIAYRTLKVIAEKINFLSEREYEERKFDYVSVIGRTQCESVLYS